MTPSSLCSSKQAPQTWNRANMTHPTESRKQLFISMVQNLVPRWFYRKIWICEQRLKWQTPFQTTLLCSAMTCTCSRLVGNRGASSSPIGILKLDIHCTTAHNYPSIPNRPVLAGDKTEGSEILPRHSSAHIHKTWANTCIVTKPPNHLTWNMNEIKGLFSTIAIDLSSLLSFQSCPRRSQTDPIPGELFLLRNLTCMSQRVYATSPDHIWKRVTPMWFNTR